MTRKASWRHRLARATLRSRWRGRELSGVASPTSLYAESEIRHLSFMSGGVSHVDTFDPKLDLDRYHGRPLDGKGEVTVRQGYPGPLMRSPFSFQKYGQSGIEISEIFPHVAQKADEIAFIRSMFGKSNDHVMAHYELVSGTIRMGSPSLGPWVTYGLGTENENLPAFVVLYDARGGPFGGSANWSAKFMPSAYQGTVFRPSGDPILDLKPAKNLLPGEQRERLDLLAKLNDLDMQKYPGNHHPSVILRRCQSNTWTSSFP